MTEVGSLWVRLLGDAKGFESAMAGVSKKLSTTGKKLTDIGGSLTKNVTLPIIALGTGAVLAATEVEGAMANIRAGTGATGPALGRLQDDFRAVFKRVPQDADQVSTAITDLNVRLGLTGAPLRAMTEQMLELADLTGLQVQPLIAATTRVFGDWAVATADQSQALDQLFVVSQTTGIGVDRLSEKLVQYGAPLRAMNFTMEESAAMLGKWEQEGVNTELVLGSLRIAMGNFARDGVPMREGLNQTIAAIQALGPGADATALAMEVFGARAGPDMAAAILEGRFELDSLLQSIEGSPETIMGAGEATETLAEKMATLRNNATLAIEPIGTKLVGALETLMPQIMGVLAFVADLTAQFAGLPPSTQNVILGVVGLVAAIGPLLTIVGKVMIALPAIKAGLAVLLGPVGLVMAAVALLATAWTQDWGGIQAKTATAVEYVKGLIQRVVRFFSGLPAELRRIVSTAVATVKGLFTDTDWGAVGRSIIDGIVNGVRNAAAALARAASDAARSALDGARNFLGIRSPSEVAARLIGAPFVEGINMGILRELAKPHPLMAQRPETLLPEGLRGGYDGGREQPAQGTVINIAAGAIVIHAPYGNAKEVEIGVTRGLRSAGVMI